MKVEGIWKVEMLGPYGWEAVSTAFLENGRYLSGSQDHYVLGRYLIDGDNIRVEADMHPHSELTNPPDASETKPVFAFEGEISEGVIRGQIDDDQGTQSMTVRGTRLGDLA